MGMKGLEACTNAELIETILRLEERIVGLEKRNAELEAEIDKLRKNSSTSSKPPCSDIIKPPKGPASAPSPEPALGRPNTQVGTV